MACVLLLGSAGVVALAAGSADVGLTWVGFGFGFGFGFRLRVGLGMG